MQDKSRSNAERSDTTRKALIVAARKLFVSKGFAGTGTPEIVRAAKVTRGALYHHFDGKPGLFRAVLLAEAQKVADRIARETQTAATPLDALLHGARTYFAAMSAPGRARLLLIEGPAALPYDAMREINQLTGEAELRQGLEHVAPDAPLDALTDLLSAMFDRAALAIASGHPPEPYAQAIDQLLRGLTPAAHDRS